MALDDFEHLSQYDPDDEFLRSSRSASIIESILSKKSVSQTSDFSIVSSAKSKQVMSCKSVAFVEPNRDVYAEDVITQKIIYYISLFSDDVSDHLQKIRSKKVLFSTAVDAQRQEDLFIFDLDDIDTNFVNLILDVLEYYELFRLCLMLCNRYHLSERLGRYLVSVCSKYSNLHLCRFNIKTLRASTYLNEAWLQKQRVASIIGHEALHNVFSLLEPKFLQIKGFHDSLNPDNCLGMETYRTMLDLGFWKKLVYIGIESSTAIQLCYKFFDRENIPLLQDYFLMSEDQKKQVDEWQRQGVLRNAWLHTYKSIRDIKEDKYMSKALQEATKDFKASLSEQEEALAGKDVEALAKLHQWLYLPIRKVADFLKPGQKLTNELEEKITDKIFNLDEQENKLIFDILTEQGTFKPQSQNFNSLFFAFQLLALPGTSHYSKFLNRVRDNFDQDNLQGLIEVYCQCVSLLNLDERRAPFHSKTMLDALYSAFLVSSLAEDIPEESQSVLKHYRDN